MDQQSEDQDKVRRLRLPSGKQIEVVVFGATGRRAAAEPEAEETVAAPSRRLHVCRDCGSNIPLPDFPLMCSACGGLDVYVTEGEELQVESIELEEALIGTEAT